MVAEEVDPHLELECQIISRSRQETGFDSDDFNCNESIYFSKLGLFILEFNEREVQLAATQNISTRLF